MKKDKASPFAALRALKGKVRQGAVVPHTRTAEEHTAADEARALAELKSGTRPLPAQNRAELHRPLPSPEPRPRDTEPEDVPPAERGDHALPAHWFTDIPASAPLTPEQRALREAMAGVTPIRTDRVALENPKPGANPRQHLLDEQAALAESIYAPTPLELRLEGGDELAYLRHGMSKQVLRDLRRGRWVVEDAVDLHGCNRDEARELLGHFMAECRKHGKRCVRIIHGKGLGSPGREPVLKKLVAGWLMNYDDVLAYCQARVHDGGAGALIVLLKARQK